MNPELRRNLWLEVSAHRLVAVPAVIALVIATIVATAERNASTIIAIAAIGGFALLAVVWGCVLASNSIGDELAERTWDWQRLSTLQPWAMTWGKLAGSTVFAWYGGVLSLLVFLFTAPNAQISGPLVGRFPFRVIPMFVHPIRLAATLLLFAVMMHAGAMASVLQLSRNATGYRRRPLLLLPLVLLLLVLTLAVTQGAGWLVGVGPESAMQVSWYGWEIPGSSFVLASVAALACWAVLGAYRSMCQALTVRRAPVAWLLFVLFLTVYSAGFFRPAQLGSPFAVVCGAGFLWSLLFTYVMLFTEQTGPQAVRRIARKARLGDWRGVAAELPCWPLTWLLCLIFATGWALSVWIPRFTVVPAWWGGGALAYALLAGRDAGILSYFLAAPRPKRAVLAAVVYIYLLGHVLPLLLDGIGAHPLAQLLLGTAQNPFDRGHWYGYLLGPLTQAVAALALAWHRMRSRFVTP